MVAEQKTSKPTDSAGQHDRFRGCLLGGAVGDALGAPVEFLSGSEIQHLFGPGGITGYAPAYGGLGRITDDTQMTLFTAEGLLRAWVRGCLKGIGPAYPDVTAHAYLRWLRTQGEHPACYSFRPDRDMGWLFQQDALHSRRAPGMTCLSALREMKLFGDRAQNDSKGCGSVMRIAPVGLYACRSPDVLSAAATFDLGAELATLTHGHPTAALSAGVFAVLIRELACCATLSDGLKTSEKILNRRKDHAETLRAIERAKALAASNQPWASAIAELGQGWIAEEALAISLYCSLVARDFEEGVILAVNHDGDSDSTGSMTGNLLGAMHGVNSIPREWLEPLELGDTIAQVADDLYGFPDWDFEKDEERIWRKYPGW